MSRLLSKCLLSADKHGAPIGTSGPDAEVLDQERHDRNGCHDSRGKMRPRQVVAKRACARPKMEVRLVNWTAAGWVPVIRDDRMPVTVTQFIDVGGQSRTPPVTNVPSRVKE